MSVEEKVSLVDLDDVEKIVRRAMMKAHHDFEHPHREDNRSYHSVMIGGAVSALCYLLKEIEDAKERK